MHYIIILILGITTIAVANPIAQVYRVTHRAIANDTIKGGHIHKRDFSGTMTYYAVGQGACGQNNVPSDFIVALNSAQFGGSNVYPSAQCFKSITISHNGKQVGATVMYVECNYPIQTLTTVYRDECPTCNYGDLDLSEGLFTQFEPTSAGVFQATWWFNDGSSPPTTTQPPKLQPQPSTTYVAINIVPTTTSTPPQPQTTATPSPSPGTSSSSSTQISSSSSSLAISSSSTASNSTIASSTSSADDANATTDGVQSGYAPGGNLEDIMLSAVQMSRLLSYAAAVEPNS